MKIESPGYKTIEIKNLIFDFNGTLAVDGLVENEVKSKLNLLANEFNIYILTADTYGNAIEACKEINAEVKTFAKSDASKHKMKIVKELGACNCACIGNGRNDIAMFEESELSVAIIGSEGAYSKIIHSSDICVTSITNAIDLFSNKERIIAGLRG